MVIPVLVAEVDESDYPQPVPPDAYGEPVWQGAYVLHVSLDGGISLQGRITHVEDIAEPEKEYYYYYSPFSVERSLYIGDVLYTISQAKIMMNSLENLDYINEVELPHSTWTPTDYMPVEPGTEEPSQGAEPGSEGFPK
jgi:hypothetical protein